MSKKILSMLVILSFSLAGGCVWRDNFLDRLQPQQLEQPVSPTLNHDVLDFEGDPRCEDEPCDNQMMMLPDIDGLSAIPELPDHPAGAGCATQY